MRRLVAGGVAAVLVMAACSADDPNEGQGAPSSLGTTTSTIELTSSTSAPSSTTSTTRPASGPGPGGVAVIADDQAPPTLNPWAPDGHNIIVGVIGQAWIPRAWDIDAATLELIPDVLVEIPRVSNGGVVVNDDGSMTVRYRIRDEARWSDGVPISGEDFAFTLAVGLDSVDSEELSDQGYGELDVLDTEVGAKTFAMTLRSPTIMYEGAFEWLLPAHVIDGTDFPGAWLNGGWPAGGPFVVDSQVPFEHVTMVRNEAYWKTDGEGVALPYLDELEFRFLPETEEILRAFRAREVDVINPPPSIRGAVEPLLALEAEGVDVQVREGSVWEHLNFQFGPGRLDLAPDSCNENLAFRRAVMHAIDREQVIGDYYAGQVQPLGSYLDPFGSDLGTRAWDRYPHDPETARALYEVAVAETGRTCGATFSTTSNGDMRVVFANTFAPMFEAAGIPMDLELMDSQLFFGEVLDEGTWNVGQWAWSGRPGLANAAGVHQLFDPGAPPPDGQNVYRWGTPDSSVRDEHTQRFAEILTAMRTTVDDDELRTLIREAEEILADQAVILPLQARPTVGAVWADEVGGYKFNPTSAGHTWNVEWWYRTDR